LFKTLEWDFCKVRTNFQALDFLPSVSFAPQAETIQVDSLESFFNLQQGQT